MTGETGDAPPDPRGVASVTGLAERLRALRWWAGQPSLRQLRQLGGFRRAADGDEIVSLPESTTSYVLRGERPASAEFLRAFVAACLRLRDRSGQEITGQVERWHAAWLAVTGYTGPQAPQNTQAPQPTEPSSGPARSSGAASDSAQSPDAPVPQPRQLPADTDGFTGRSPEISELEALIGTVAVTAVTGPAGVGKTALAVRVAHQVAGRFPDGQLYVDMRGHGPGPPRRSVQALARFLRALGVPNDGIPSDSDEAAATFRSVLAGRRVLVLVDNVASADQVRPLLPGTGGCAVLVTSRHDLCGLVACDGARRLRLDTLHPTESRELLGRLLGADTVAAEPAAVAALAVLCGHLPLALRIAGANVSATGSRVPGAPSGRGGPVGAYRDRLAQGDRLTALSAVGDEKAAVRTTFGYSYTQLARPARRMFRLLGLVPGPDITVPAAAALAAATRERADGLLAELAAAHLVVPQPGGRYALHDLLRLYARELAEHEETASTRDAALRRLCEWYLHRVDAAADLLYPDQLRLSGDATDGRRRDAALDRPTTVDEALGWLTTEHANLVHAILHLSTHLPGEPLSWRLADSLRGYLFLRCDPVDWLAVGKAAASSAEAAGDDAGRTAARLTIGMYHLSRNEYPAAHAAAEAALPLARRAGWDDAEVALRTLLGCASARADEAVGHYLRALHRDRRLHRRAEPMLLLNLAAVHGERGELLRATAYATRALTVTRERSLPAGQGASLRTLGDAYHLLGDYARAERHLTRARAILQEAGARVYEAYTIRGLALVHHDFGHSAEATQLACQALALARQGAHPLAEAAALVALGDAQRSGEPLAATESYQRARHLAGRHRNRYQEVEALLGLATLQLRLDDPQAAEQHAEQARAVADDAAFQLLGGAALTRLATVRLAQRRPAPAADLGRQALAIHQRTGYRAGEARTHVLLAEAAAHTGDHDMVARHRSRAHCIFARLGIPA